LTHVDPPPQKRGGFLWILAAIGLALGLTLFIVGTLLLSRDRSDQRTSTQTQLNNLTAHVNKVQGNAQHAANKAQHADAQANHDSELIYATCLRFQQDEKIGVQDAIDRVAVEELTLNVRARLGTIYDSKPLAILEQSVMRRKAQVARKCPDALLDALKETSDGGSVRPPPSPIPTK